ncbi:MAG: redoxin domain-containing protein, partial [Candidatus Nanohaloarchaea archaeon]
QVEELKQLDAEFSSIAVVGTNPNVETHPMDSFDKMSDFMEEKELDIYYLADPEQKVAEAYGAKCTPDPFLLDWRHRLYYHGRLNDGGPSSEVENREMKEVIGDMLKRRDPPQEQKPSQGCSIKWKEGNR